MLQDACRLGRLAVGYLDPEDAQTPTDQLLLGAGRALGQGLGVVDPSVVQDDCDLLSLIGLERQATRS